MKKYILSEDSINSVILNEKIKDNELHEYSIIHRETFIDTLIGWISEAKDSDKVLMKEDLKELISWENDYIFSSCMTNSYIGEHSTGFDKTCKELLELHDEMVEEFKIGDTVTLDRYNHIDDKKTVKITGFGEMPISKRLTYKMDVNGTTINSTGISIMESKYYKPVPIEERHLKK